MVFIMANVSRLWIDTDGSIYAFGRGRPTANMLANECDATGTLIAGKLAPSFAVKAREPVKVSRFYLDADNKVQTFGQGRPSFDKLARECDANGNVIASDDVIAKAREPRKVSNPSGTATKLAALESQLAALTALLAAKASEPVATINPVPAAKSAKTGKAKDNSDPFAGAVQV